MGGKVQHSTRTMPGKDLLDEGRIAQVTNLQWHIGGESLGMALAEVVEHHHGMPLLAQLQHRVRTDVTGATGDEQG